MVRKQGRFLPDIGESRTYTHTHTHTHTHIHTMKPLYNGTHHFPINWSLSSVSNGTFVNLKISYMRTSHYILAHTVEMTEVQL